MLYSITRAEVQEIADALAEYYDEAWGAGVKSLVDRMAQSQMGIVTKYLDQAKDTYNSLKKKSADSFRITFKAQLKMQVGLYFSNKSDVATALVTIGEKAIELLADKIPVPHLGSVVTAVSGFAADKAKKKLHERSITEADKQLEAKSGAELQKFFTSDLEASEFIANATKQYKTIGNYINMLPNTITTFDDAITYPKSTFKLQQAASSLNVSLWRIIDYLEAMSERLVTCQEVSKSYIETVRTKMPEAVENVLQRSYADGVVKGKADITANKYSAPGLPTLPPKQGGGATLLAHRVAHAVSQGYYNAGNTGPKFVTPGPKPPLPPKPLFPGGR
jgi:hypothetical protein